MTLAEDPVLSNDVFFNGGYKCLKCGKWCRSWHGFRVHYSKRHIKHPIKPKPEPKPLTLWDLRYGGKKWNQ
jgi:hypothetical protein